MDGALELAPLHDISACLAINGKCYTLKLFCFRAVVQKESILKKDGHQKVQVPIWLFPNAARP